MLAHQSLEVGAQHRVAQHGSMESPVDLGCMLARVFDQLHVGLQSELGEQLQRRGAQQLREPCMEGPNLDRTSTAQDAFVQFAERRRKRTSLRIVKTARAQLGDSLVIAARRRGEFAQPVVEPLTHLACRLAGECDREDLVRLRAGEQRSEDSRHQHPRLAGAGTSLDDDAAAGVASGGIERVARHAAAIDGVRGAGLGQGHVQ